MEECSKQRNIRNEIELIKKRVSSHIDTDELLKNLHLMDKFK